MRYVIIIVFFGILYNAIAQDLQYCTIKHDTVVASFNHQWEKVPLEQSERFVKAYKNDKNTWTAKGFDMTGKKQMTGIFRTEKLNTKEGYFIFFFQNGKIHSEGNFTNNKKTGEWNWWFDTGEIKENGHFDKKGKKTGYWKSWYSNGILDHEGSYIADKENNEWKWYFKNGQQSSKELYKKGKLISFEFWNEDGSKVEGDIQFDELLESKESVAALMLYIVEKSEYPERAKQQNITGRVFVEFKIEEDGTISNQRVIRSPSYILSQEALRLINSMPDKWMVCKQHNRPIVVTYAVPIKFTLNE